MQEFSDEIKRFYLIVAQFTLEARSCISWSRSLARFTRRTSSFFSWHTLDENPTW